MSWSVAYVEPNFKSFILLNFTWRTGGPQEI